MTARHRQMRMWNPEPVEILQGLLREAWQKGRVIPGVHEKSTLPGAGQFRKMRTRADRHPYGAQIFERDVALQAGTHVARCQAGPDDIGEVGRYVVQHAAAHALVMGLSDEGHA